MPQPDIVSQFSRGTKDEPVRWPIHTGDFVLTSKAANHVLVGRVVSEADGKPVAKALILRGGFQSRADENGRFRFGGLVSGNLELHASAAGLESEAAAPDVSIEIPETPVQIERTLKLGIKYAEARPGQTDVRIVMPDPNERLRGID